jgi:hypothetical protein
MTIAIQLMVGAWASRGKIEEEFKRAGITYSPVSITSGDLYGASHQRLGLLGSWRTSSSSGEIEATQLVSVG